MASINFKNDLINIYRVVANEKNVLKNYIIEVIYSHNTAISKCGYQSINNNHKFDIYINDILCLQSNLNNQDQGTAPPLSADGLGASSYDRYSAVKLSEIQSESIVKMNRYGFILKIMPAEDNFYSEIDSVWVRIRDPRGNIIYNECTGLNTNIDLVSHIAQSTPVSEAECADQAKLDFMANNLVVGKNYQISYHILDAQYLNSDGSISFGKNSFTNRVDENQAFTYYHENGSSISGTITANLHAIQSILCKIELRDADVGDTPQLLSSSVSQIICPMCSAEQHSLYYNLEAINSDFNIRLLNLDNIGEVSRMDTVNDDNQNIIVKIQDTDDSNYIDLEFSGLTINNEYQYDIFVSPTVAATELEFEPNSFRFHAGDNREVVSAKINLANNPIVLLYVTLKDITSDITKQTQPIYIVNTDNFNLANINDNVEFVENTKSIISKTCT